MAANSVRPLLHGVISYVAAHSVNGYTRLLDGAMIFCSASGKFES